MDPFAAILLTAIAVGAVFAGGLLGAEIAFRNTAIGDLWKQLRTAERTLRALVDDAKRELDVSLRGLEQRARRYEEHYIRRHLRRSPIRALNRYISSVRMSWAALENAGITDLESFVDYRGNFEAIHQIGEARGRALRGARQKLQRELADRTVPMPPLRPPGTAEFDAVSAAVETAERLADVSPVCEQLEEELTAVADDRPNPLAIRWRTWRDDRDRLEHQLTDLLDRLQQLDDKQGSSLREHRRRLEDLRGDFDAVHKRYRRLDSRVHRLLDDATERELRGTLRPVGVDALRTAEGFDNEDDFCTRVLEPLLENLGFQFRREHTINERIGSKEKTLYVDFLLRNEHGQKIAVLEAKHSIGTDTELQNARDQGISYAMFENVTPVIIAAKEGLWVYERRGREARKVAEYEIERAFGDVKALRELIVDLAESP